MKILLSVLIIASIIFVSCSETPRNKDVDKITTIEQKLVDDSTMVFDKKLAIDLIQMYTTFSDNYPADSITPDYLFKAGRLAMNMNNGNKSIQLFDRILKQYPNFDKLPETVFLSAFVYENILNDNKKAKVLYLRFMKDYPDNILYNDAKASIDNMGKSLEDIIKGFEKKDAENTKSL